MTVPSQLFFVTYDLDKPGQDYTDLWNELDSLGAQRVQESVWVVRYSGKTVELRDLLKNYIDSNDRLLVVRSAFWASVRSMVDIKTI
jgi:CRISPR-associated endonuclease Cas2